MDEKLTKISREAFDRIAAGKLSPAEAADYLLHGKPSITRGFGETLVAMFGDKDEALKRIRSLYLELDPTANGDNVTRSIRNWLNNRNPPSRREDIFRIAFALDLTEADLDYLLALADGYALQYRDGRELVLAWFLRMGRTYQEALAFLESLPVYDPNNNLDSLVHSNITHALARDSFSIGSEDELRTYYETHIGEFGTQHARAYYYLERYLSVLKKPEPTIPEVEGERLPKDGKYTIDRVVDEYMTLGIRRSRNNAGLAPALVLIKKNWPSRQYLSNIKCHERDVPRNLILLLYVITESAGIGVGAQDLGYVGDETLEERLYDHITVIDAILRDCGMAELDMRNAFDWLVLYSVAAEHEDESMSERFEEVVSALYPESGDPQE